VNGFFVAWELKVGKNPLTELQQYNLKRIREAGGIAREVTPDNLEEAMEELWAVQRTQQKGRS
jgi:hypothetical protein